MTGPAASFRRALPADRADVATSPGGYGANSVALPGKNRSGTNLAVKKQQRMRMTDQNPRQRVSFPSGGREAHGCLAIPSGGAGPGVIVIQEWWGLTDHIAAVADRLAGEGFVALAPDLFGGVTTHDADEAGRLLSELPVERAAQDLGGAVDFLLAHDAVTSSKVGAVGFCMGGGFVLLLAAQQGDKVAAAVPYYGVGPAVPDSYQGLTAALQ